VPRRFSDVGGRRCHKKPQKFAKWQMSTSHLCTLERPAEFGGRRNSIFTLVMRKGPGGWRIMHDHTSAL